MQKNIVESIDALLPQTQCGLCGYGGCMPYAKAIAENQAAINLCPPGGTTTLIALSELLQVNAEPYLPEMLAKTKPPTVAIIREADCIGCTKCIQACPVDAIIGSRTLMHTVIANECTGCDLCIPACPVDCIDTIPAQQSLPLANDRKAKSRSRYLHKNQRMIDESQPKAQLPKVMNKQQYIKAAIERAKRKKVT